MCWVSAALLEDDELERAIKSEGTDSMNDTVIAVSNGTAFSITVTRLLAVLPGATLPVLAALHIGTISPSLPTSTARA